MLLALPFPAILMKHESLVERRRQHYSIGSMIGFGWFLFYFCHFPPKLFFIPTGFCQVLFFSYSKSLMHDKFQNTVISLYSSKKSNNGRSRSVYI
mmetsp:Transcript_66750/g.98989  ORF Transcript_66750/g.98989 Transcript_66750/m.98989 type:complete len:95 (+) Transcript_66750:481-765(+)